MRCFAAALVSLSVPLAAQQPIPTPKSTALPVTATSAPFGAAIRNVEPVDLARRGYVEEEFLLSGTANVYDWAADGSVSVKTPNAPYTDRILVRRPANASRFTGTVIVEIPNTARRFDWYMMWSYAHEAFMDNGYAWVGITMPGAVESLKAFDAARYGALAMANPTPGAPCPGAGKGGPSNLEEGLRWDIFSQVAAALKSSQPGQPMAGFKVERVFMTTQGGDITTYINAIHDRARLENGKPAYDGYLVRNPPAPVRINQCAPAIAATDPRRLIKNVDVPVVSVAAEGEAAIGLWSRKPDSDDPAGRYRLYEIAGAAHIDHWAYVGFPSWADQTKATGAAQGTPEWPFNAKCDPDIPLSRQPLLKYAFHAAYYHLDQWARKGTPPPKAPRLEVSDGKIVADEFGHGKGGVRSPWVDAPVYTTVTSSPGPGTCRELGHHIPFDAARLTALYGGKKEYENRVSQSVDRAVKAGFFREAEGKKMKADLASSAPPIGARGN
jgi:hypothetical protein